MQHDNFGATGLPPGLDCFEASQAQPCSTQIATQFHPRSIPDPFRPHPTRPCAQLHCDACSALRDNNALHTAYCVRTLYCARKRHAAQIRHNAL